MPSFGAVARLHRSPDHAEVRNAMSARNTGLVIVLASATVSLIGSITVTAGRPTQAPPLPTRYLYALGAQDGPGRFAYAQHVETGPSGQIYVTDGTGVQVLAPNGAFLRMWGGPGHGDAQFDDAGGVAVGADGRVLVADRDNGRVQGFDADGTYRGQLTGFPDASLPTGQRRFQPVDVAVAADGGVFVGDGLDSWVAVFSATGTFIRVFGGPGRELGQIAGLTALTLAPDGTVWVGDGGLPPRVHAFTPDGQLLRRWEAGPAVRDLAVTASTVYVVGADGRLRAFTADGVPVDPPGGLPTPWPPVVSVAALPDGTIELLLQTASSAGTGPARLVHVSSAGEVLANTVSAAPAPGALDPVALDTDLDDRVYVADDAAGLGQVQVLDPSGLHQATWPDGGGQVDMVRSPAGIAVAPLGPVYVSDAARRAVSVLDDAGRITGSLGGPNGSGSELFGAAGPGDVAASHELSSQPQRVFVTDPSNGRVVAFDYAGALQGTFGSAGDGDGQFVGQPTHLATSPQGWVYVTDDSATQRVQIFDYTGKFRALFHGLLGEDARFAPLTGIDYAPRGTVYLGDPRQRIQAVTVAGEPVGQWDIHASRPDLAVQPGEVVAGRDGRLYVADRNARRVHVFVAERPAGWRQETFDNPWLAAAPRMVGWVPDAALDWGDQGPGDELPADGCSVRLARFVTLEGGVYQFKIEADGAVRLRVDDHLSIDDWRGVSATRRAVALLNAGEHYFQVEYADLSGPARLSLAMKTGTEPFDTPTPGPTAGSPPPSRTPAPPTSTATPTVTPHPGACPDRGCRVWLPYAAAKAAPPAP
jgi:hypothetical protein